MTFELEKEEHRKDYGYFYIYKRADRKKPTWNVFIKLDGDTGFTRKSLKTEDKNKAYQLADVLYKELQITGTTKTHSFDTAINEYELTISKDKFDKLKYPKKFWTGKNISSLSDRDIQLFIAYRESPKAYQDNPPPKKATLRREFGVINQFFRYAYSHSYTKELLKLPTIIASKNPRPSFSEHEWSEIIGHLSEWKNLSDNKAHIRSRTYLQTFILLLGNTGIRPMNEVSGLTWRHLDEQILKNTDGYKYKQFLLNVPENGKTGTRQVIPNFGVKKILMDFKKFANPKSDAEFIFANRDETPIKSFQKSFASFLTHYGLLKNSQGQTRSPYSLRHYYCEHAVREGIDIWHLSKNTGTSLEMLQSYYVKNNLEDVANTFKDMRIASSNSGSLKQFFSDPN